MIMRKLEGYWDNKPIIQNKIDILTFRFWINDHYYPIRVLLCPAHLVIPNDEIHLVNALILNNDNVYEQYIQLRDKIINQRDIQEAINFSEIIFFFV